MTPTDAGGVDVIIDDAFARPDTSEADAAAGDAADVEVTDADTEPQWPPLPETENTDIRNTVIASRSAIDAYCGCCIERFGNDLAQCRSLALDGGFEVDACEIAALENLDDGGQASAYLRCLQVGFSNLETNALECGGTTCLLSERDFQTEATRCAGDFPSAYQRLALCE